MKKLDKYIAKNFLIGYAISFCVLMGLRIIIDLFVNLDEFAEHTDLGTLTVLKNMLSFYGLNMTLYFRDFAGMITVVAAAFSFGRMVRANELVAIMASGISLKRVAGPVIVLALLFTVLLILDQELLIPSLSDKLVRDHDELPGQESYDVWFLTDENGSLICSRRFDAETATLFRPTIITRRSMPRLGVWEVVGRITAEKAVYNRQTGRWELVNSPSILIMLATLLQKTFLSDVKLNTKRCSAPDSWPPLRHNEQKSRTLPSFIAKSIFALPIQSLIWLC
jgi:lipopolysaccharide export system permease protein